MDQVFLTHLISPCNRFPPIEARFLNEMVLKPNKYGRKQL